MAEIVSKLTEDGRGAREAGGIHILNAIVQVSGT